MKRALLLLLLAACGGGTPAKPDAGAGSKPAANAPRPGQPGFVSTVDGGVAPPPPAKPMDIGENELTESDHNRDPFRSFANMFIEQAKKPSINQRTVILAQYSIDELKLVGIVQSGDYPRAMLVDPAQKGWIVKKGDFVGRPDVVHTGGQNGADYQLNWRVDRVRDGDIVLTREDPAQPGVAPATRVIPLRSEQEESNPILSKTN